MFDASIYVSEQLTRLMVNASQDLAQRCVTECAQKYGFDAEEAIRSLGIHMIKIERKPAGAKKLKAPKAPKEKVVKSAFPLPYNGEFNDACCYALRQNSGLYTQCSNSRKGEASFCKACSTSMLKTGAETPEYGTIQQRQAAGIFDYVDPKGRKPVAFTKVMKKYKLTQEQVIEEAGKFNMTISDEHFVAPPEESKRGRPKTEKAPKEKGQKGRPKKSKKVLEIEGDEEDLFAALVAEANSDSEASDSDSEEKPKKVSKEDKAEKEAKKATEKAEKEAKKAAEKAEKEAKAAAEKAEKEAKAAEAKAEKEAKIAQAKAEKEAKIAQAKAAKEAKKSEKDGKKKPAKEDNQADEPLRVKKITFDGKKYLLSAGTGVVYDYEEYVNNQDQVVVGKWNEAEKNVIFNKSDSDNEEEEEEEYDM
jgi:hypothetical protein